MDGIKINKLLKERLTPHNVPSVVIDGITDDLMRMINSPQAKKHGATIMTPEASMAGDKNNPFSEQSKPQTI